MNQEYYNEVKIFLLPGNIEANCNGITFINTGTNACTVNGITLQPNQSLVLDGNRNEIDRTSYYCNFTGAGVNQLTVIRKLYTGGC
jgi:hypothetical protein